MSPSPFQRFLDAQGFVVLDGGLATAVEATGHRLDTTLWSAALILDAPEAIREAHLAFLAAGADCIETAGYQATVEGFERRGLGTEAAIRAVRRAVELALEARAEFWAEPANRPGRLEPIVAASAGPYGAYLADGSEYHGRYDVGRGTLERFHRERLAILAETDADVIALETIPSTAEAEVICEVLADFPDTWAWLSFTCRDGKRLGDGSDVADAVSACGNVPTLAGIGVNCTPPRFVDALVTRIAERTALPIVAYPNSGESWDKGRKRWLGTPAAWGWVGRVPAWLATGALVLGGCCRVGPDVIRDVRSTLEGARGPS